MEEEVNYTMTDRDELPSYNEENDLTFNEKIIKTQLESIRELQINKKYDEALTLMEAQLPIISDFENRYEDTDKIHYCIFNESFEQVLYNDIYKPTKAISTMPTLSINAYTTYGIILNSLKRYDDAITYLKKALFRNPLNTLTAFQLLEAYKGKGDMKSFFEYTKEVHKFVYTKEDIARVHRCLGYYFVEKENWNLALACYNISRSLEPQNTTAIEEIKYIIYKTHNSIKTMPSFQEAKKLAEKAGCDFGPNEKILSMAYKCGSNCIKSGKMTQGKYYLSIVANITHNKEIIEVINSITENENKTIE